MSRLIVVTHPSLVNGFHLAGVNAFAAVDVAAAQQIVTTFIESGESGLLAVDEALLAEFDSTLLQRLANAEKLPYLALPSGKPSDKTLSGHGRIAQLLRQAVGFHITFRGNN